MLFHLLRSCSQCIKIGTARLGRSDLPASGSLHLLLLWSGKLFPLVATQSALTSSSLYFHLSQQTVHFVLL